MSTTDVLQSIVAWGAGAAGLVGSAAFLRRRLTRDQTEMTMDRAEGDFVGTLLKERDAALVAAREAMAAREKDGETIARLSATNEYLTGEIARARLEFAVFRRRLCRLYPVTREFVDSDSAPLDPLPPHTTPPTPST